MHPIRRLGEQLAFTSAPTVQEQLRLALAAPPGHSATGVSLFRGARSRDPWEYATLAELLERIRAPWLAQTVARVRAAPDKKAAHEEKQKLPAFTASVLLSTRDKAVPIPERIIAHTGLLQCDFDAADNPEALSPAGFESTFHRLAACPYTLAIFRSPSGTGIKVIIRIPADLSRHLASWFAAAEYYDREFDLKLDPATKDPVRLCYLSHDPNALWRPEAEELTPEPRHTTLAEKKLARPAARTASPYATLHRVLLDSAWKGNIPEVRRVLKSIQPDRPAYEDWIRYISATRSVLSDADAITVLNERWPEEHPGEYAAAIGGLTKCTIGTLIHCARRDDPAYRTPGELGRPVHMVFHSGATHQIAGEPKPDPTTPPEDLEEDTFPDPPDPTGAAGPVSPSASDMFLAALQGGHGGVAHHFAHETSEGRRWRWDANIAAWRFYDEESGLWRRREYDEILAPLREFICDEFSYLTRLKLEEADAKAIRKLETSYKGANGLPALARHIRGMAPISAGRFDSDKLLLACPGGIIDLRLDGHLIPHAANAYLTRAIPYTPAAGNFPKTRALFMQWMEDDTEKVDLLLLLLGFALTGYSDIDRAFFMVGSGANGKSLYLQIAKALLGPFAFTVDPKLLLEGSQSSSDEYVIAEMEGRRLVVTAELPTGKRLNSSAIKKMIGGDPLPARHIRGIPYTYIPHHVIIVPGNTRPAIVDTDNGIWRRIVLLEWNATFPGTRKRHEIMAEIEHEFPALTHAALQAFFRFRNEGANLKLPASVIAAAADYRDDEDQAAQFIRSVDFRESPGAIITLIDLFAAYETWCRSNRFTQLFRRGRDLKAALARACPAITPGWHLTNQTRNTALRGWEIGRIP